MSNNWYENESWYAPLRSTEAPKPAENRAEAQPKKRSRRAAFRAVGAILLALAFIVGSSLIFSQGRDTQVIPFDAEFGQQVPGTEESPQPMPEDPDDFFANYYTKVETQKSDIRVERSPLPIDFQAELRPAQGEELTLQELYARCAPSVVAITGYVDGMTGYNWGTGVILSADGLILTNTHVIENCDRVSVTLYDDRHFDATLVGADATSDVSLLKIDAKRLPAAELGQSGDLVVGDRVAAIGNPLGETFRSTLTDGIISAIERGIQYNGRSMTLLQTNTALNEGNSGGALFNMYGQVVGVTNMKMMSSYSSIEGIGFAIPSSTVRQVVNLLVQYGEARGRPSIGITVGAIPDTAREEYDLPEGLYVSDVVEQSDAAAKGIRTGDIITEVNHTPVTTTEEISKMKDALEVGDTMLFTIWRDGETLELEIALMDTNDIYG